MWTFGKHFFVLHMNGDGCVNGFRVKRADTIFPFFHNFQYYSAYAALRKTSRYAEIRLDTFIAVGVREKKHNRVDDGLCNVRIDCVRTIYQRSNHYNRSLTSMRPDRQIELANE